MGTYRISSLGYCPRVLSATALEYEPLPESEFLKLAAREGTRHEQWVVEDLESEGWQVTDRQKEVKLSFPAFELVGHIDGVASRNGDKRLLEIKSMSRFRYAAFASSGFARFRDYAVQITTYHQAVNLPILYVVKNRDSGKRLDLDMGTPPLSFDEIYDGVVKTEIYVRKKQLCPAIRIEDFTCRTCRFRYLCEPEEKVPVQIDKSVLEAAQSRRRAIELEAEAKEIRAGCDPVLLAVAKQHGSFNVEELAITFVPEGKSVSYPVAELRKVVPADVLEQVKEIKKRASYIKVEDLRQ